MRFVGCCCFVCGLNVVFVIDFMFLFVVVYVLYGFCFVWVFDCVSWIWLCCLDLAILGGFGYVR